MNPNNKKWFLMLIYLLISFIIAVTLLMLLAKLIAHLLYFYQSGIFYFPISDLILSIKVGIMGGSVGGIGVWVVYRVNLCSRK
ncbi:Uncharacterised protein [Budvicia aquatica]|uniref:Uncharacterized protein n=1 Tax=Budvicia aquatica TaxID=82979 RepID=A0A484ZJB9_9GAMM|nr:Uncharacterised protein [Budvicia aquatica]